MDVKETVLAFLRENTGRSDLAGDTELLKSGLVNSLFALEVVVFVERTFGVKQKRGDITPENFSCADAIAALAARLKGGA